MNNPKYIPLEELDIYKMAMEIEELVWDVVNKWEWFVKKTVGGQLVEAADSIAANISEGYARFHFKEKRTFYYYARGSLSETKTWITKSKNRNIMDENTFNLIHEKLKTLHKFLNSAIKALPIK